jgi:hypothetical protein
MVGAALPGLSDHIAQELGEALAAEQDDDEDDEDDEDEPAASPGPQRQGRPAPELLSVDEIRALGQPEELLALLDVIRQKARAAASMKDNTDSKRVETAGRAANPRQ